LIQIKERRKAPDIHGEVTIARKGGSEMQTPFPRLAIRLALPLCVAFAVVPALAQQPQGNQPMQGMPGQGMPGHQGMMPEGMMRGQGNMPESRGSKGMMDSMQKMQRGMMAKPMTGDTDHDFATMMREHHRGAVDMARMELEHGKDQDLKRMAQKVIEDQSREIKELDEWLDQHPLAQGQGAQGQGGQAQR
jgi:uncharacterized protein (DUF305 family)